MMTTTPNPSEEQIEKAARAFFREYHGEDIWPELRDDGELDTRSRALAATRVALTAAGVAPQPVIDEAALAEVIADAPHSGDPNVSCLDPRCKAAAVAAWLREGVAPQEPSQTETKSGNNFVSLDPEGRWEYRGRLQSCGYVAEGYISAEYAMNGLRVELEDHPYLAMDDTAIVERARVREWLPVEGEKP